MAAMRIDIVTLFPRMFEGVLGESILKIAQRNGAVEFHVVNPRDFTRDNHRSVDDRPYGGGPGMVLMCEPVIKAVRHLRRDGPPGRVILTSAAGAPYRQAMARTLAQEERLILIAGHYEGHDERIIDILQPLEVSVGDYVLTGGELPAMAIVDSVVRLLPGAVGCAASLAEESFSQADRLEYPQYTRPAEFEGHRVPEVLLSGNHQRIAQWRAAQSYTRTRERRPDLLGAEES
jgi:tRNA (guanine37-N1)-methyltransferase